LSTEKTWRLFTSLAEEALEADLHPQFILLKDPTPVERSLSKQPDFFKALPHHTARIVMPARVANGCQVDAKGNDKFSWGYWVVQKMGETW
jgi:hypothetical protein